MEATTSTEAVPVEPQQSTTEAPGILPQDLCPVQETIRLIGRKWYLILLWELSKEPGGFNELKERAGGISAKMLSQSLSGLEHEGLVLRDIVTERPLRVCYHLTEKARDLAGIFDVLRDWGLRNGVCDSRVDSTSHQEP